MRRQDKWMGEEEAWALLERAPTVQLASVLEDGTPVLREVHPILLDGHVAFHGSPKGEKMGIVGRPAVVSASESLGIVPSWAFDARRACPATTWYRSVQVHGVVEPVEEPELRIEALRALMTRFQPEGGHLPMEHAVHAASVRGISILRLRTERVSGKMALGQGKPEAVRRRVVEALWYRGEPDGLVAIENMLALEDAPIPERFAGPGGTVLCPTPTEGDLRGAVALLHGQYWNEGLDEAALAAAHRASDAWVVARHGERVVATARALSDGVTRAWVLDVAVAEDWRARGLGRAVMRLLLEHPHLRHVHRIVLGTRDAEGFYEGLGFEPRGAGTVAMGRGPVDLEVPDWVPAPGVAST